MRPKKGFTTKHRMLEATNLHQPKKFTQPLVVTVETFRRSGHTQEMAWTLKVKHGICENHIRVGMIYKHPSPHCFNYCTYTGIIGILNIPCTLYKLSAACDKSNAAFKNLNKKCIMWKSKIYYYLNWQNILLFKLTCFNSKTIKW